MTAARMLTDAELLAEVRAIVRDESERLEARLRGQRIPGQRRTKSPAIAAAIAEERAGSVDEVARARGAAECPCCGRAAVMVECRSGYPACEECRVQMPGETR